MQFKTVNDFLTHIHKEIQNNRLELPSLPDVALKVREVVATGNASASDIAAIISTDTVIAARLIQIANSPLYSGNTEIKSIQLAISRLGNTTIRTLVTSIAMRQLYTLKSKTLESHFESIWEESIEVASISRALATFTPHLDADEAMLAGLLHQIGKLPILVLIEDIPEFRDNPARLEKLLDKAHRPIAKIIMDSWNFPDDLKLVASEYSNTAYDSGKGTPASYVDIVHVAFFQHISKNKHHANDIDWESLASFNKLGFTPEIEVLEIKGIPDKIKTTRESLF
jgi:HD-like signal output (HDOD) protein